MPLQLKTVQYPRPSSPWDLSQRRSPRAEQSVERLQRSPMLGWHARPKMPATRHAAKAKTPRDGRVPFGKKRRWVKLTILKQKVSRRGGP